MHHRVTAATVAVALASSLGAARAWAAESGVAELRQQLDGTRQELADTRAQLATALASLKSLTERVDALQQAAPAPQPETGTARIAPVNVDNPAVSFVVDTTFQSGSDPEATGFALQSGELFVSSPIDPFLRGYATLNGSSESGFDIEEAALVTTALPWNLQVTGGRFFADVGRLSHWHDEALPFTDRPPSLEKIIGGESGAEGVEVSWLAPTDLFFQLTAGVYNAIGSNRRDELADLGFLGGHRSYSDLTWLLRPTTYVDLTDDLNLELGATWATVPHESMRNLLGVDATLRHQPGTSGFYQGFVLGAEWLWNDERFDDVEIGVDPVTGDPIQGSRRFDRNGGYVYGEAFFGRQYSAGLRFDDSEEIAGDPFRQQTYSAFATWMPSEFHRLRLQLDEIDADQDDQRVTLQWTAFLGSHRHGFQMR